MEPGLITTVVGYEPYTIPDGEMHYFGFAWNMWRDNAKGPVRKMFIRDVTNGYPLFRGPEVFRGYAYDRASSGIFLNPTNADYADPRAEYFRKIAIIRSMKQREVRNFGTAGVTSVLMRAGNSGIAGLRAWNFDKAWAGFMAELGDGFDATQANVADQRVHQEFRDDDVFTLPFVLSYDTFMSVGSGHGFDWTANRTGGSRIEQGAPVNGFDYVHLPLSFHGVTQRERYAPNGHVYCIATVPDDDPPADAVDLTGVTITDPGAGSVTVDTDSEWIKLVSSGTDYDTGFSDNARDFAPSAGRSFLCEFYYPANTKLLIGVGTGTGIGTDSLTHGITVENGTLKVYHDSGSGRVVRTFGLFTLATGNNYRLRITFGSSGTAYYELQGTQAPAGTVPHITGETDWWDLMEGYTPATGDGHSLVRMKAAVGGTAATYYLLNWPRIAAAHSDVPTRPGATWHHSLLRPVNNLDGYPWDFPFITLSGTGCAPDRQGATLVTADSDIWPCNAAGLNAAVGTGDLVPAGFNTVVQGNAQFNAGFADAIYEGSVRLLVEVPLFYIAKFNIASDGSTYWRLVFRPSDGLLAIEDNTGTQQAFTSIGSGFLGAYSYPITVKWKVITIGDYVEVWFTKPDGSFVQAITNTFTARLLKTQTYFGFRCPDSVHGYYYVGGFDDYEGLRISRAPYTGSGLVDENFTAANGTTLSGRGITNGFLKAAGTTWQNDYSAWDIQSNKAVPTSRSMRLDSQNSRVTIETDITFTDANNSWGDGILFNCGGSGYKWFFGFNGAFGNEWYLVEDDADVRAFSTSGTPAPGTYRLKVVADGDTVTGYVDGVQVLTYNITNRPGKDNTWHGPHCSGYATSGAVFDNFLITGL
jgi:hypothetical protein